MTLRAPTCHAGAGPRVWGAFLCLRASAAQRLPITLLRIFRLLPKSPAKEIDDNGSALIQGMLEQRADVADFPGVTIKPLRAMLRIGVHALDLEAGGLEPALQTSGVRNEPIGRLLVFVGIGQADRNFRRRNFQEARIHGIAVQRLRIIDEPFTLEMECSAHLHGGRDTFEGQKRIFEVIEDAAKQYDVEIAQVVEGQLVDAALIVNGTGLEEFAVQYRI